MMQEPLLRNRKGQKTESGESLAANRGTKQRPKAANIRADRVKQKNLMPKQPANSRTIIPKSPQKLNNPESEDLGSSERRRASNWEQPDELVRKISHDNPDERTILSQSDSSRSNFHARDITMEDLFGTRKSKISYPLDSLFDNLKKESKTTSRSRRPPRMSSQNTNAATFGLFSSSNFTSESSKSFGFVEAQPPNRHNSKLSLNYSRSNMDNSSSSTERYDMLEGLGFVK